MSIRALAPVLLTGLLALSLSGCGTFVDPTTWFADEPEELKPVPLGKITAELQPEVLWRARIGSGADGKRLALRPAVVYDRVYAAAHGGEIVALALDSGDTVWRINTGLPIAGGPGAGDGLLVVGTTDGQVVAFDELDGSERWRVAVSSEVLAVPAVRDGRVVVHTVDGAITAHATADGAEVWRYTRENPILTIRGSSSPVIERGVVYCGLAAGRLVALDLATGAPLWEAVVSLPSGRSELERLADVDGRPVIVDNAVYAGAYQGNVAAIGQASGNVLWQRELSLYRTVAADWQQVYATDAEGVLWALDSLTGAARWKQDALLRRQVSAPAALGGVLAVGDFEGYLHWLDRDDGQLLARQRIGSSPINSQPLVHREVLYVLGDGGELAAIRLPAPPDQP